MFSIKGSLADCASCELLEAPSCILETNCKNNLKDVEIIFVSENPGKSEVTKEIPLIGKSGQTFRGPFNKYIRSKCKWLLTNCVLCCTINPDGTTGNPSDSVIDRCKVNCFDIIEICDPKLIVLMGASPMKAFGISKAGITNMRGQFFKWKDRDVLLTVHPSFVNRNRNYKEKFVSDILLAAEFMGEKFEIAATKKKVLDKKGVFHYKIPDQFYGDHRLVDVQFLTKSNQVLYIFRDKENRKIYHREDDNYWCYQAGADVDKKKIVPYDQLNQLSIPYKQKTSLDPEMTYEGDMKITVKHAQDYYLQRKIEEPETDLNVLYTDIEIYSEEKLFPKPENADYPICMITNWYHGKFKTFVIDPKALIEHDPPTIPEIEGTELVICKSEKELMTKWLKDLKDLDPDIISGWNVIGFDIFYIFNRLPKLGIPSESLSKFGEVAIDGIKMYADIAGITVLDQLRLYQMYTFTKKESYKLGYIAQEEIGETKLDDGQFFSDLFKANIGKAIKYNIGDVDLLVKLEDKLKHIQLQNELKKICKVNFNASLRTMGLVDGLIVSLMKEKGLASKNADIHAKDQKIEGAFVKEPIKGVHDYIVDFDFTSLYPSLIITYNMGINTWVMKFKDTSLGYEFMYNRDNLPDKVDLIIDPVGKANKVSVSKDDLIKKVEDNKLIPTISGCFYLPHEKELSIYSEILDFLMSSRKTLKKKMFDAKQAGDKDSQELFNIRQIVFKVIANSVYGVIANNSFRFYSSDIARSITLSGQEAIKISILSGNSYVDKIKSNKYVPPEKLTKQEMYGDVSRYTQNVITGDTDSLFITYENLIGKKESDDEIQNKMLKWNDEIQTFLNETIIRDLISRHNMPMDRNRLELKNELICKRGLFLAKKRYTMNVTSQEGRKTDEIIYMGLDVKRSDYPSLSKEGISELIKLILKSQTISPTKIMKFVTKKEIEISQMIKNGDKTIARPVAFVKPLKEYKRIPPGVISMLNWNDIEYQAFSPGDRGYLFKIQGLDLMTAPEKVVANYHKNFLDKGRKLESIAVPSDENKLPSYYIVDLKAMLKFSWTDRYNQILEPILKVDESQVLTF